MITVERCQYKLAAVRHLDVGDVVARGAGPAGFGPQSKTFAALERYAGETTPLIVRVATCSRVLAFQKLHHCRSPYRVRYFSSNDLHQQTRSRVGGELVAVLTVWTTRHALAAVSVFAERLLIHVDVRVAERREIAIDSITLILPRLHLFRRQLVTAGRMREHVEHILRRFV